MCHSSRQAHAILGDVGASRALWWQVQCLVLLVCHCEKCNDFGSIGPLRRTGAVHLKRCTSVLERCLVRNAVLKDSKSAKWIERLHFSMPSGHGS